jgi:hypothetical protein
MNGSECHGASLAGQSDDRNVAGQRRPPYWRPQRRLLAYCAASGVVGTIVAGLTGPTASGAAGVAVWVGALGAVSVLAGLTYYPRPASSSRTAAGRSRRRQDDAGTMSEL